MNQKSMKQGAEHVAIRLATPEDHETILAMNQESVHFLSPLTIEKLRWLHEESEFSSVVEIDGQVGAFLIAFREGSSYDSPNYTWFAGRYEKFLYIDRVVVFIKHQGKGLGTLLYKDAFQRAALMKIPVITAEIDIEPPNPGSLKFHKEFGFSEVGTQAVCDGKKQVSLQAATFETV
jgi:predicted GNAT superfamily acetyltransferase